MNLDKLDEAIAYIEKNPEFHNQARWFSRGDGGCGTAYCLAGAVALLDGWKPVNWEPLGPRREATSMAEKDGVVAFVDEAAMNVLCDRRSAGHEPLNADEETCSELFEGDNTLDDIKRIRDAVAAGER